jgi:hypothetical protein
MTILFTQYWDVNPGEYDDYAKFISEEFNPGLEKLGMKLVGGFYVAVGAGPRIMAVATMQNGSGLLAALSSREYRILSTRLHEIHLQLRQQGLDSHGHVSGSTFQHSDRRLEIQPVLRYRPRHGG